MFYEVIRAKHLRFEFSSRDKNNMRRDSTWQKFMKVSQTLSEVRLY